MDTPALTPEETVAATLDWWREAGVEHLFHDDPRAWLAEPEAEGPAAPDTLRPVQRAALPAEPEQPPPGGDPAGWPADLESFRHWWLAEPSLDAGGTFPRVASHGPAGAELLVLVPMPEESDSDALLSGPQGRLVANMARAMGIAPDALHLAAALPRHMPVPDWDGLAPQGFGAILRHFLALARPRRLMVLGQRVLPLLGHDPAQGAPTGIQTDIGGVPLATLAGFAPQTLLERAPLRAGLWRAWLEWTEDNR